MGSMIDLIGSFVIASMFMVTIFNSLFNINAYSTNLQFLLNHTRNSEKVIEVLDSHILANVGWDPATRAAAFPNPSVNLTSTKIQFWGGIDRYDTGNLVSTLITLEKNSDDELIVYLDGTTANLYAGPFQLKEYDSSDPDDWPGLDITYLDANGNPLALPINNTSNLYGVVFDMTFVTEGHDMDWGEFETLPYRIKIWKYFKNLYL